MKEKLALGTLQNRVCPACHKSLDKDWVACPYCGSLSNGNLQTVAIPDRFICPGCGERSDAKGWNAFCPQCQAFVHFDCMEKHMFTPHCCPICRTEIGE